MLTTEMKICLNFSYLLIRTVCILRDLRGHCWRCDRKVVYRIVYLHTNLFIFIYLYTYLCIWVVAVSLPSRIHVCERKCCYLHFVVNNTNKYTAWRPEFRTTILPINSKWETNVLTWTIFSDEALSSRLLAELTLYTKNWCTREQARLQWTELIWIFSQALFHQCVGTRF